MHISLPPELEAHIKIKVESGLYNNTSEVIREALGFVKTHEEWINELKLARLREQLQQGVDQLDCGEGTQITSKAGLDELFEDLKT
ncbi:type II toxin-antitoxin system ParD family antitoxin [Alloalcanivorax profundimaris]|uniref:type II toxin-antitoxin system ParD family antitoxin n=1 Tax=Alloalcanivorax profundimaris TaxID=2735259 RepID=UPI001369F0C2|nr:type II toxin-antitoxin system ParD family antitoxin [Alloalcanivorax profundimaris]MBF1803710.1 type II toxin-antitoxin system ParD family antitoxin [Alloalcanivorax profundimaris]MBM1143112.1 type II toxin-antitoxin system ParD family antitoxin [Alcanivorax sp. ZXX171]MCQ6261367.1 type II toxin-antitoxin system ParD family antitoxin [Alcanivorax sp. MM125-6]